MSDPLPDRTKRVKDAKNEAQKEIDEYRQKKEEEFKKFESDVCGYMLKSGLYADTYSNKEATRKPRRMPTRMPRSNSRRSSKPAVRRARKW